MPYASRADGRDYDLLPAASNDPVPLERAGKVYCKILNGQTQLYFQSDDGSVYRISNLTDGPSDEVPLADNAAGSAGNSPLYARWNHQHPQKYTQLVFDSGGAEGDGITYNSYDSLFTRIAEISGQVLVVLYTDMYINSANSYDWTRVTVVPKDVYNGAFIEWQECAAKITGSALRFGDTIWMTNSADRSTSVLDLDTFSFEIFCGKYCTIRNASGIIDHLIRVRTGNTLYIEALSAFGLQQPGSTVKTVLLDDINSIASVYAGIDSNGMDAFGGVAGYDNLLIEVDGKNLQSGAWAGQSGSYNSSAYNRLPSVPFICRDTFTGNKDNYRPPFWRESQHVFFDPNGVNRTISGFDAALLGAGGGAGTFETAYSAVAKYITNTSVANTITLQNENAASLAANRILSNTGADLIIPALGCALVLYDDQASRWRAWLCVS